jgi:folate-binding protein YgfZ
MAGLTISEPDGTHYAAASAGAGLFDRSERGKLALSGPQAVEFLDSLLSQDIAAIPVGGGADATLLDHKGHMLAEVRVLRSEDELLLDCERAALQALFDALSQFGVGWQAQLHKRTLEMGLLSVVGAQADRCFAEPPPTAEHEHAVRSLDDIAVRLVRTRLGVDVLCPAEETGHAREALLAAGALAIDEAAFECVRIEAGIPRYGVELDASTMPQEAGLHERAVSFTKGCYIGQETVARLYWKGKPNRHLRRLVLSEPVAPGASLLLGERDVGRLASSAVSPRLGPVGMAIIRREAQPGAVLAVAGECATATVVDGPATAEAASPEPSRVRRK